MRAMKDEVGCGFQTAMRLIVLYAAEVVVLTAMYRFVPAAWFHWLFIPVIVAVIAIGWITVLVRMKKRVRE